LKGLGDGGRIANDWRNANSAPVFQKGQKNSPGNYRPFSFSLLYVEIMEQDMLEQTYNNTKKQMIWSSQHGFLKAKSYLTNLLAS